MANDLVEYIVKSIVGDPAVVSVAEVDRDGHKILKVYVAQRDMARVMGSRGLVIRAIRTVAFTAPHDFEDVVVEAVGQV